MARSHGARLAVSLARRSMRSKLIEGSPISLEETSRRFTSGICGLPWVDRNFPGEKSSAWTERLCANWCPIRSFHATRAMSARDYYDVLGVSKSATASEIKSAFYALAKKLHPDTNKEDAEAQRKFQEAQKAYEVLKDESMRAMYDQVGHESYEQAESGGGGPTGADDRGGFNPFADIFKGGGDDFFSSFFGRNQKGFGGQDIKVSLELSFMEAVQGCTKVLSFQAPLHCEVCDGTGVPPGTRPETCRACKGSGMTAMQRGAFIFQTECRQCGGAGKIVKNLCKSCHGQRVVMGTKSAKIDVMPGIDNSDTIRMTRSGGADPEGGQQGDLLITIKVREDPIFRREGSDVHVDAVLSVTQAILGGTVQVPTLTGDVVLKVRQGTQPGQKVVLKGKGIKNRNSGYYGNHYVHFNVSIPTHLTQRQRMLIEEFATEERNEHEKGAEAAASASG